MTTVITRLYSDSQAASAVVADLTSKGFPDSTVDVLSAASEGDHLGQRMMDARIPKSSIPTYMDEMQGGASLLVVRAPFTPFGAAREAMKVVDAHPTLPSAVANNNVLVKDDPNPALYSSVLSSHPLFLTNRSEMSRNSGRISTGFGMRMLSRHKTGRSAISGGRFMSRAFWPMPLLSAKKDKRSVYSGGKKFLTN